jgi:hypothetical protein
MSEFTRRMFVTRSATAAAGMTALGALGVEASEAEAKVPPGTDPVVAYVRNPTKGEISLMAGEREVTVTDPKLAARITRAAK